MRRKPREEKYVQVPLRLHPRDAERLRARAEARGLSLGALVAALLDVDERREVMLELYSPR